MSDVVYPEAAGEREPPRRAESREGWCFLIERNDRFGVGDWVVIEGVDGIGEVVEMFSNRFGGRLVTVRYPQGVWFRCREKAITHALSVGTRRDDDKRR